MLPTLVLDRVLDLLAGALQVSCDLVLLALGLEVTVVGVLSVRFLDRAFRLLSGVLGLVLDAHYELPSLGAVSRSSYPSSGLPNPRDPVSTANTPHVPACSSVGTVW